MASDKAHTLPVRSLNHVSRVCKDVKKSAAFYRDVLGFVEVKRPSCFEFEGSWLFNYNVGIHLIKGEPQPKPSEINPKADHWSFQSDSLKDVEKRLKDNGVPYITDLVTDGIHRISQIFFHDPDNNMIEICNCDCMPMVPLTDCDNDVACRNKSINSDSNNRASGVALPFHAPVPNAVMQMDSLREAITLNATAKC